MSITISFKMRSISRDSCSSSSIGNSDGEVGRQRNDENDEKDQPHNKTMDNPKTIVRNRRQRLRQDTDSLIKSTSEWFRKAKYDRDLNSYSVT